MINLRLLPKILTIAAAAAIIAMAAINVAYASSKPQVINAIPTTLIYTPGTPVWNPYAPNNLIGTSTTYMPLAMYNQFTGVLYPVLAENWTMFPDNKTFIIYLRHDLYWFNGSAVIPFTAWDVYAEFYIGVKAFGWYYPWLNASLADQEIRVLNNYTIEFIFQKWSPQQPYYILTTEISTPWPIWKPIVEELKTMNATQASAYSYNITKFVAPYWALAPYYISSISSSYITLQLEPDYFNGVPLLASWYKVFPFAAWQYYSPTFIIWYTGGNTQSMTAMMSGKASYSWVGLSQQQVETVEKAGVGVMLTPDFGAAALIINPLIYPFNIPQVRQAFLWILNRTEIAASWGLMVVYPEWINTPTEFYLVNGIPNVILYYPKELADMTIIYTVNWTKAAQLLESAGLYKKGNQWYLPNGTPLTLTIIAPSGWTDWVTMASVIANELTEFGIPTKVITLDTGVYWGTTFWGTSWEAALTWTPTAKGYPSIWMAWNWPWWVMGGTYNSSIAYPIAFPKVVNHTLVGWYCEPVVMSNLPIPNGTIVTCVNSTFGYFNTTNWQDAEWAVEPTSPEFEELGKVLFAWWEYYAPEVDFEAELKPPMYSKSTFDPNWLYDCLPVPSRETVIYQSPSGFPWGSTANWLVYSGGVAPPGEVPPLAQLIINGSLWTKYPLYASFLGLTPEFGANIAQIQSCVASYFHVPYTPVTTTTTTTTTTSTVTTTAVSTMTTTVTSTVTSTTTTTVTTTAVSTVTVTKPVISTALIAGIVIIVVVIAIVAALIALRRR